ncbi:MAG: heme ABC transporter permease [Pseudomonadota bacterium]
MSRKSPVENSSPNPWRWFHRFGSPEYVYGFSEKWAPRLAILMAILFLTGLYLGLVVAPPDYQMGDNYRIIFIHVPSAWMSMSAYFVMALAALCGLVWHMKVGDAVARACAPVGAMFTICALVSGSLWGKPTWGTYWVWDARLTSFLVLLFLYLGYIALVHAFEDRKSGTRAAAVLAIVGVINLPIIHYSVEWWNTLHQGSTVTKLGRPSIDIRMLIPLLIMFVAYNLYFVTVIMIRLRTEILTTEYRTRWVANRFGQEAET